MMTGGTVAPLSRTRLSVVIAAYNAAATLPDQLEALIKQGTRSWEILVCDNGSTDNTTDIVRQWARHRPEIVLVDASARRGPAAARNIGVTASKGELIAFCDADDIVGEKWADTIEAALESHSFVAGRFDLQKLASGSGFSVSWSPQLDGLSRLPFLPELVTAGAGNMAMRREVFESIDGFDETSLTAEDDDLCLRAQLAGYPLVFVPELLLHVRKRSGLIPTFRQAMHYGCGARKLEYRYALVEAKYRTERTVTADPTPGDNGQSTTSRLNARVHRLLRPSTVANLVWRIGWRLGYHRSSTSQVKQMTMDDLSRLRQNS